MIGYIIKNTNDVTHEMWDASLGSEQNAAHSVDSLQVLIKFESETVPSLFSSETILTKAEVKEVLRGEDWANDI